MESGCVYDLAGVVDHRGALTGGHYVAYARADQPGPAGEGYIIK